MKKLKTKKKRTRAQKVKSAQRRQKSIQQLAMTPQVTTVSRNSGSEPVSLNHTDDPSKPLVQYVNCTFINREADYSVHPHAEQSTVAMVHPIDRLLQRAFWIKSILGTTGLLALIAWLKSLFE